MERRSHNRWIVNKKFQAFNYHMIVRACAGSVLTIGFQIRLAQHQIDSSLIYKLLCLCLHHVSNQKAPAYESILMTTLALAHYVTFKVI